MVNLNNKKKHKSMKQINRLKKISRALKNRINYLKKMSKKMNNKIKKMSISLKQKVINKRTHKRNRNKHRNRKMKGGDIAYSALPCHSNGSTAMNSTAQVGAESCIEYGTDGAENNARAGGLDAKMGDNITATIKDVVSKEFMKLTTDFDPESVTNKEQGQKDRADFDAAAREIQLKEGGSSGNTSPVTNSANAEAQSKANDISGARLTSQAVADAAEAAAEAAAKAAAEAAAKAAAEAAAEAATKAASEATTKLVG